MAPKPKKPSTGKAVLKPVGRNGGMLWAGPAANPVGGTGRPPDQIRAKLRELGYTKALPFLTDLLSGKVSVSLLGKCDACGHDQPISEELVEQWMERVKANTDQRLKASEQTMKYGLQTKELVITGADAAAFFDCVSAAAVELYGPEGESQLLARAVAMMEARK